MKRLRGSAILMIVAILGITGFQGYWLKNNYDREKQALDIKTNASFRQTILKLQSSKLKLETISLRFDSTDNKPRAVVGKIPSTSFNKRIIRKDPPISVLNLIQERMRDSIMKVSGHGGSIMITVKNDTIKKLFLDSLRKIKGTVRTISLSSSDSLFPRPEMIEEVQVNKGDENSSGRIRIGYGTKPQELDSFSFHTKRDVLVQRGFPAEVHETMMSTEPIPGKPKGNAVFQFLYDVDSLSIKDSVTLKEVDSAYALRLKEDKIDIGFKVNRLDSAEAVAANAVTIGFSKPTSFGLSLQSTFGYMFSKLKLPILFSLLLVGLTIASFVLLYRNMLKQQRLAELKNDFISNITHELKTPIATVGVAIEALKSFNAIHDPKRTQEYLDISQNELQRLNLLVDKVLKLSMFEKKEIELKYETFNLRDVVDEVLASMRLQIEKYQAQILVNVEGDCSLQADRLHLLSVVFNLLDNALKYGKENPEIKINLEEKENTVLMTMADNGIGIPSEYKDRVFDKFFRIPHGDTHNAKGYGLGLSYVAHVIKKHKGSIEVKSETEKGATFVITLPKQGT
jgi:two-component system phosphate regulon sensor histidine kinase PhoR